MATRAPSRSNSCAAASPIPLLPPVIRIFLFASLLVIVTSLDLFVVINRTVSVTFKTVKPGRCFCHRLEDAAAPEGVQIFDLDHIIRLWDFLVRRDHDVPTETRSVGPVKQFQRNAALAG